MSLSYIPPKCAKTREPKMSIVYCSASIQATICMTLYP